MKNQCEEIYELVSDQWIPFSNPLPFPFLSHKWYQGQALDENELNYSACIETDTSEILPYAILSRD